MADVQIAVCIWRTIMQHIFFAALGLFTQFFIEPHLVPLGNDLRLFCWKSCPHREICFWKKQGLGIIAFASIIVGHRMKPLGLTLKSENVVTWKVALLKGNGRPVPGTCALQAKSGPVIRMDMQFRTLLIMVFS